MHVQRAILRIFWIPLIYINIVFAVFIGIVYTYSIIVINKDFFLFSDIPEILLLLLEKGGEGATPKGEGGKDSETCKACRMIFNNVLAVLFQQVHGHTRHR